MATGCVPAEAPEDVDQTELDIQQYEEITASLEAGRQEVMGEEADELIAVQDRAFWLQFPDFNPDLYSWAPDEAAPIRYGFSIGGDEYNYRASKQLVVTAESASDNVIYHAYGAATANEPLGELTLEAPKGEQRWWAYSVDGGNVYIVTTGDETTILRWMPGAASEELIVLEDLGMEVGEVWDLFAYHGRLLLIESGRLWLIDPVARTATWLQNQQEVSTVSINKNGVVYPSTDGPQYVAFAGGPPVDLGALIEESTYELNTTFSSAHHYASHPVLFEEQLLYVGQSGIFSLDIESGEVEPLLLEPRDPEVRLVYRDPQVLDDGTLFLQGLASTSGAIGADGPIYMLRLEL